MARDDLPVTVIGAGIAGLACARRLREAGVGVQVRDRGRAPGGRLGSRTLHGRPVDLGASYLTASDASPFAAVVGDWLERGLVRPWTDTFSVVGPEGFRERTSGPMRYGTPAGTRSLAADLAAGLDVVQGFPVQAVRTGPSVDGRDVRAAVLAMPDPQAARLLDPSDPAAGLVAGEEWEPALAVVLGWPARRWPADLHGAFVHDDPSVGWIADDGDRRGDAAPVLVAHTTAPLAAAHLADPAGAVPAVVASVRTALGIADDPAWTEVHRWTFARPASPRDEPFGLVDGIGLCGDGWRAPSKVESAWTSGDALGRALAG